MPQVFQSKVTGAQLVHDAPAAVQIANDVASSMEVGARFSPKKKAQITKEVVFFVLFFLLNACFFFFFCKMYYIFFVCWFPKVVNLFFEYSMLFLKV